MGEMSLGPNFTRKTKNAFTNILAHYALLHCADQHIFLSKYISYEMIFREKKPRDRIVRGPTALHGRSVEQHECLLSVNVAYIPIYVYFKHMYS